MTDKPRIQDLPAIQIAAQIGITLSFDDADKVMKALQNAYRAGVKDGMADRSENVQSTPSNPCTPERQRKAIAGCGRGLCRTAHPWSTRAAR